MVDTSYTGDDETPNSQMDDESENQITKDEVNKLIHGAITKRLRQFDQKLDNFLSNQSTKEEAAQETKEERLSLKKLQNQIQALQQEKQQEIEKRKTSEMRRELSDALSASGIPQHSMKAAMAVLLHEDKSVMFNDFDELVFKNHETGEDFPLSSGIAKWAKSEDAKAFLPPTGAQGSGDTSYAVRSTSDSSKQLSDQDIVGALLDSI